MNSCREFIFSFLALVACSSSLSAEGGHYCTVAIFESIDCAEGNCDSIAFYTQVRNGVLLRVDARSWLVRSQKVGRSAAEISKQHTRQIIKFVSRDSINVSSIIALQDIIVSKAVEWEPTLTRFEFVELDPKSLNRIGLVPLEIVPNRPDSLKSGAVGHISAPQLLSLGEGKFKRDPIKSEDFVIGDVDADTLVLMNKAPGARIATTKTTMLRSKPSYFFEGLSMWSKATPSVPFGLVCSVVRPGTRISLEAPSFGVWTTDHIYKFFSNQK